jgi:hypothetical protein
VSAAHAGECRDGIAWAIPTGKLVRHIVGARFNELCGDTGKDSQRP